MSDQNTRLSPVGVVREALGLWARHIVAASALYGVNILLARFLHGVKPVAIGGCRPSAPQELLAFAAAFLIFLVLNSWVCLLILGLFQQARAGAVRAGSVAQSAVSALAPYLKTLFLLWGLIVSACGIAYLFLVGGNLFYATGASQGLRMAALLATHTFFVVVLIAAAWYGFFFSLAPLVASCERKGAWEALRISRQRIRGNALRYGAVFAAVGVLYAGLSAAGYFVTSQLGVGRTAADLIEACAAVLVGPVWLAAWLVSYQKLTAWKKAQ